MRPRFARGTHKKANVCGQDNENQQTEQRILAPPLTLWGCGALGIWPAAGPLTPAQQVSRRDSARVTCPAWARRKRRQPSRARLALGLRFTHRTAFASVTRVSGTVGWSHRAERGARQPPRCCCGTCRAIGPPCPPPASRCRGVRVAADAPTRRAVQRGAIKPRLRRTAPAQPPPPRAPHHRRRGASEAKGNSRGKCNRNRNRKNKGGR
jgi:hypothetical protein